MFYILDEHDNPKIVPNAMIWSQWFEKVDHHRIGKCDKIVDLNGNMITISTVFVGIGINIGAPKAKGLKLKPYLWETVVFGGHYNLWERKWCIVDDALAGHQKAIEMVKLAI